MTDITTYGSAMDDAVTLTEARYLLRDRNTVFVSGDQKIPVVHTSIKLARTWSTAAELSFTDPTPKSTPLVGRV
jgi:hypothetical protein